MECMAVRIDYPPTSGARVERGATDPGRAVRRAARSAPSLSGG